jgi:predicted phage gp36 major capsid-like protein
MSLSYADRDLSSMVAEIQRVGASISAGDTRMDARIDEIQKAVNDLYVRAGRPGASFDGCDCDERKSAIEMCKIRHAERMPKIDVAKAYEPSAAEIDEAMAARPGFSHTIRHGTAATCDAYVQKSLSAFQLAGSGMLAPPERMAEILSCVHYPSDISGLVGRVSISGPSAQFLIENPRMGIGSWACEASCFANNPQPDLADGLGITQMPDVNPGATPVAYGNWQKTYTIVYRKAVTIQVDHYSANFCTLFKCEARVGGAVTCGNAARLLRIR